MKVAFLLSASLLALPAFAAPGAARIQASQTKTESQLSRINIQTSPVSWLVKRSNVSVSFGTGDSITLGLKMTLLKESPTGTVTAITGQEVGFRGTYHWSGQRFASGILTSFGIYQASTERRDVKFTQLPSTRYRKVDGALFEILGGYSHYFSDVWSGLNLDVNAGFQGHREERGVYVYGIRDRAGVSTRFRLPAVIEMNVGYAF